MTTNAPIKRTLVAHIQHMCEAEPNKDMFMTTNAPIKRTLVAHIQHMCEAEPNKDMFVTYSEDMTRKVLTRQDMFTLASRLAYILKQRGISRGDVVVNTLPVSLEAAVVIFGSILAGGAVVTVDVVTKSGEELFHTINKAQSKLLVTRSDTEDNGWNVMKNGLENTNNSVVRDFAMARTDTVKTAVVANRLDTDENGDGFISYLWKQTDSFVDEDVEESDRAFVFLTSGTTGFPKLAVHTHSSIIEDAKNGEHALAVREPSNYYVATSWSWVISSPVDILWGLTRVTADFWQPLKNIFRLSAKILKHGNVRHGFLSPLFVEKVADEWEDSDTDIFDQVFVGGVPVDAFKCERLLRVTRVLSIRYGQSENLNVAYNNVVSPKCFHNYDSGRAYPGTQIRVVDDNMQDVELGDPGRILIKTAGMFSEYLNDPDKTARSKTSDGWHNSSDAGYLRPSNRNIVVIGRYDYVINHKSAHLYPAWIENPIRAHPAVAEVLVVPVPDETNYHNICACVILKPGSSMTSMDVKKVFKNNPSRDTKHVVAPQNVLFYDGFPTNARGKVVMNKLIDDAVQKVKRQNLIAKEVHMG